MNDSVIAAPPVRLPQLGLLRFSGTDAVPFLQGQVSNDVSRLARGTTVLCACSTPQGRVFAVLTLVPHSTGILAILPAELAAPTAKRLGRFVLRSKVRIEDLSAAFCVAGLQGSAALAAAGPALAPLQPPAAAGDYRESQGIGVARLAGAGPRFWIVGPAGQGPGPDAASAAAWNAWRLADIRAGLPQVYAGNSEEFVAQMLNLDLVDGISFTKGCYTGQEIIARTQHLGRIKRRMFRVAVAGAAAASADLAIGTTVRLADGRSGRICEWARAGDGLEALAVLPLEAAEGGAGPTATAGAAGVEATLLDLPYSLSAGANSTRTLSSSSTS
jgi:folate-binding protein YgfZ